MATTTGPIHPDAVRRPRGESQHPAPEQSRQPESPPQREPLSGAYFWLVVFFVVYCARPEDWIPGLRLFPLAKISGIFAALALVLSVGRSKRRIQDLPPEVWFTLLLTGWLIASSMLSPIWRGGALQQTLDFAKLLVAMLVGMLVVTSVVRLRRLLFVQAASVVVVSAISMEVGHSHLRVNGVLGGMYGNPNDLAFAIALTVPLCFAFTLRNTRTIIKAAWAGAALVMAATLLLTGSRGGLITFGIATLVCVWHFGVQGKRPLLVLGTIVAALALFMVEGGIVTQRFADISANDSQTEAHASYEERRLLIGLSMHAIADHPLFGLGPGDFTVYSKMWREVHMAYLQVAVEGGVPALIFYLLIFWRGFANLRRLRHMDLDAETQLFAWALHGTLVGFLVGALFAPEAYQYFPFFTVTYTAVLRATVEEQSRAELLSAGESGPASAGHQARRIRWLGWAGAAR
jgi:O-antigen ligase